MVWEASAVLAAILVAFALDAWWEQKVESAAMWEALDAIAVELEQNIASMDSAVALNHRQIQTSMELAARKSADIASLSDEDIMRYVGFPEYEEVTLERGAITAFIEGGFLRTVEDVGLRTHIAGLATIQDELDEELRGFWAIGDRLTELTIQMTPADNLDELFQVNGQRAFLTALTEDETARQVIFARAFLLSIYTDEMGRLRDRLSGSLETIRRARA